jgi:hypothetical protein
MKEKMDLAEQAINSNLFPSDWIYDNVFHFSENEYAEYRNLIIEDKKRRFRLDQLEHEGNDPYETGQSYGTPHDLASLYGRGRLLSDPSNVPPKDSREEVNLGRPKERVSNRNTQDDNLGKDRLGVAGMKKDPDDSKNIKVNYKGNSPLALENKYNSILNKLNNRYKKILKD